MNRRIDRTPSRFSLALLSLVLFCIGCSGSSEPLAPEDAGPPVRDADDADVSTSPDAGLVDCLEDNSPESVAERDGFLEVCVDRERFPEAVCGDGSTYRFTHRPAEAASEGLLLYFRGGGFCNDYVSCWGRDGMGGAGRRVGTMANDENLSPLVVPSLGRTVGIFDREDPAALFARFDVVHVAYCTGDLGAGAERVELARPADADPDAPSSIPTFFHGTYDVAAALALVAEEYPAPARLVVYGSSAGSYSSARALSEVLRTFPDTDDVIWIGDGGAGVGRTVDDLEANLERFDGDRDRLVRFAQLSFQSDAMQVDFLPAGFGGEPEFRAGLRELFEARRAAAPDRYRFFAPSGSCHTLAQSVALHQQFATVDGRFGPVLPEVRPNPDLTLDGVAVDAWLDVVVRGSGPYGSDVASHAADWTTPRLDCPIEAMR
jgi:hypothetical protein